MSNPNSSEPILRSRLLPRVSFRMMLLLTAVAAVVAAVARAAGDGGAIARGFMSSIIFIAALAIAFSLVFLVCWVASIIGDFRSLIGLTLLFAAIVITVLLLVGAQQMAPILINAYTVILLVPIGVVLGLVPVRDQSKDSQNPFAEDQLPPQILPPRNPKL